MKSVGGEQAMQTYYLFPNFSWLAQQIHKEEFQKKISDIPEKGQDGQIENQEPRINNDGFDLGPNDDSYETDTVVSLTIHSLTNSFS